MSTSSSSAQQTAASAPTSWPSMAFIGGGNMASAIVGGLRRAGVPADRFVVLDTEAEARARLRTQWGVATRAQADARVEEADWVIWAVKPQHFASAAVSSAGRLSRAVHLSVMAGVRCAAITRATGSRRVVRAMPNTPALIGEGIAGVYAVPEANDDERALADAVLAPTGQRLWLDDEHHLDAVTAISGSGPAYVFYFIEAMEQAARQMGLSAEQGRSLAQATFSGAAALLAQSPLSAQALRAQVTSKGGTTHAAITHLEAAQVQHTFVAAMTAAQARAKELGGG